ncbi:MAG: CBS domain-containing protein [Xanthobacteraceae bacterium]|nr:CBS domain-containing protein [Xanthobacteraceae bacterium]
MLIAMFADIHANRQAFSACLSDELMRRPVGEMMTEAAVHVEPTAPLTRVLQLMVSLKSRSFPVIGPDRRW